MTEVVLVKIREIELGRDFPFFLRSTPSPVPPVDTEDPDEVRVNRQVNIDGRMALIFTGIFRATKRNGRTICRPYVVINFTNTDPEDIKLKAVIKIGGVEYASDPRLHISSPLVRSKRDPHFFSWISPNGRALEFIPPIETTAIADAMTLRLEVGV